VLVTFDFRLRLRTDCLQFSAAQLLHKKCFELVVFRTADVGLGGLRLIGLGTLGVLLLLGHEID
jgi:hypothetical protein